MTYTYSLDRSVARTTGLETSGCTLIDARACVCVCFGCEMESHTACRRLVRTVCMRLSMTSTLQIQSSCRAFYISTHRALLLVQFRISVRFHCFFFRFISFHFCRMAFLSMCSSHAYSMPRCVCVCVPFRRCHAWLLLAMRSFTEYVFIFFPFIQSIKFYDKTASARQRGRRAHEMEQVASTE